MPTKSWPRTRLNLRRFAPDPLAASMVLDLERPKKTAPVRGEKLGPSIHRMLWGHHIRSPTPSDPRNIGSRQTVLIAQRRRPFGIAAAPDQLDQANLYFGTGLSICELLATSKSSPT